jgi:hypothetical protein
MQPRNACRAVVLGLGVLAAVAVAPPAGAQSDEQRAAARSLATQGNAAFEAGHYRDAVELFGKAESLMHAPPHLLFMARSHKQLGEFVRAREAYLKIVKETLPPNAPKAFRDAQTAAEAEVREVEPKIANLTLRVEGGTGAANLTVKVDGVVVPSVLVGAAQPIDPGTHRVEATATGFSAAPQTITLKEGATSAVALKLEPDPNAAPPPVAPLAAPAGAAAAPANPPPAPAAPPPAPSEGSASGSSGLRIGSYVAFGVGVVGLAGGSIFAVQSASKRKDADEAYAACGGDQGCTTSNPLSKKVDDLDGSARTAQTLSIVGFALGGVGVATGVTLFILSSKGKSERASFQPWLGVGSAGLRGTF